MTVVRDRKMAPSMYESGRDVEWVKSDYYCQKCGKHDCWQEGEGGDDYYIGNTVKCFTCQHLMSCVDRVEG